MDLPQPNSIVEGSITYMCDGEMKLHIAQFIVEASSVAPTLNNANYIIIREFPVIDRIDVLTNVSSPHYKPGMAFLLSNYSYPVYNRNDRRVISNGDIDIAVFTVISESNKT